MALSRKTRVPVARETDVARAVVQASRFAKDHQLPENDANKLATAVSELARNIIKYAGSGEVLIGGTTHASGRQGIEVVVRDRGPGIADLENALKDHYSSSGTLGLGLPGVRRMMDEFEIDTVPGEGTTVTIRLWGQAGSRSANRLLQNSALRREGERRGIRGRGGVLPGDADPRVDCAYFTRPCLGERVNGDGILLKRLGDHVLVALIDGLGHGRTAHEVAAAAVRHLSGNWPATAAEAMRNLNEQLSGSIGAAAGIAIVDVESRRMTFVGVGNTVARPMSGGTRLYSVEGNLGTTLRTLREQRIRLNSGDLVLFYTDGVRDRFEVDEYPQMRYEPAKRVAQTVVERFGRSHDDATCVALRLSA